jgi:hypothetical protein
MIFGKQKMPGHEGPGKFEEDSNYSAECTNAPASAQEL